MLRQEESASKEALHFAEVSAGGALFRELAGDGLLKDEKLIEDAAAALSAASKKVAPYIRGNMRKLESVAASDASARVAESLSSEGGRSLFFHWPAPEPRPAGVTGAPVRSQRGRISERVQGALRAHAEGGTASFVAPASASGPIAPLVTPPVLRAHAEGGTAPFVSPASPSGPISPVMTPPVLRAHAEGGTAPFVPSASPSGPISLVMTPPRSISAVVSQLQQAKEVVASLDTCGDSTVMERWMRHLDESRHPMKEAEKIMMMLRALVRQGFCSSTADQQALVQKRMQVREAPAQDGAGQWTALQTSSPHGSISRGILATAPTVVRASRPADLDKAEASQSPRSLNGVTKSHEADVDMLHLLRNLKVGDA
ncbi:unnamed protein product [Effrenium voratum]|uniref:Uncharacterized protein n=1 Tax=Effrenium voratum TaxID=2562239 RepID=A0AA36HN47_9DINO|nr:unnamed protein product [Effrenium voratum]